MTYVQFFMPSIPGFWNNNSTALIEGCGDRAVIILDGRESLHTHKVIAITEGAKRGYKAFQIRTGEAFSRSFPVTPVTVI